MMGCSEKLGSTPGVTHDLCVCKCNLLHNTLNQNMGYCPVPPPATGGSSFPQGRCHRVGPSAMCPCGMGQLGAVRPEAVPLPQTEPEGGLSGVAVGPGLPPYAVPFVTGRTVPPPHFTDYPSASQMPVVTVDQRQHESKKPSPSGQTTPEKRDDPHQLNMDSLSLLSFPPNPPPSPASMSLSGLWTSSDISRWTTGNAPHDLLACKDKLSRGCETTPRPTKCSTHFSRCPHRHVRPHQEKACPQNPTRRTPNVPQHPTVCRHCFSDVAHPCSSPPCLCMLYLLSRLEQQGLTAEGAALPYYYSSALEYEKESSSLTPTSPHKTAKQLSFGKGFFGTEENNVNVEYGKKTGSTLSEQLHRVSFEESWRAHSCDSVSKAALGSHHPPLFMTDATDMGKWSEPNFPEGRGTRGGGKSNATNPNWSMMVHTGSSCSCQQSLPGTGAGSGMGNVQFGGQKSTQASRNVDNGGISKPDGRKYITDAEVNALCDKCIFNACTSMDDLPDILQLQKTRATPDNPCYCRGKEEGREGIPSTKKEYQTPWLENQRQDNLQRSNQRQDNLQRSNQRQNNLQSSNQRQKNLQSSNQRQAVQTQTHTECQFPKPENQRYILQTESELHKFPQTETKRRSPQAEKQQQISVTKNERQTFPTDKECQCVCRCSKDQVARLPEKLTTCQCVCRCSQDEAKFSAKATGSSKNRKVKTTPAHTGTETPKSSGIGVEVTVQVQSSLDPSAMLGQLKENLDRLKDQVGQNLDQLRVNHQRRMEVRQLQTKYHRKALEDMQRLLAKRTQAIQQQQQQQQQQLKQQPQHPGTYTEYVGVAQKQPLSVFGERTCEPQGPWVNFHNVSMGNSTGAGRTVSNPLADLWGY